MHRIYIEYPEDEAVHLSREVCARRGSDPRVYRDDDKEVPHRTVRFRDAERQLPDGTWIPEPTDAFSIEVVDGTWRIMPDSIMFQSTGGGNCKIVSETASAELELA